jgi:hypothetical protein
MTRARNKPGDHPASTENSRYAGDHCFNNRKKEAFARKVYEKQCGPFDSVSDHRITEPILFSIHQLPVRASREEVFCPQKIDLSCHGP